LETQREDINEIKKYVHMNGYDQKTIKRLLLKLFSYCCNDQEHMCDYADKSELNHLTALSVEELVEYLDVKEETILTLFCYLESLGHIKILQNCYNTCTIRSYKGFSYLNALSKRNAFIAAILKQNTTSSVDQHQSELKIDVMRLCDEVREDFNVVRQKLRKLEWNLDDQGNYKVRTNQNLALT
jgi:ATP-dependent DNA helicase Q4